MKVQILTNKSQLQEVYHLRVIAYEKSPQSDYVNRDLYPNGWFDHLDHLDTTVHFIISDNNKIIAAARLVILEELESIGKEFSTIDVPQEAPFAFWSRLVVHPDYRKTSAMMLLDRSRKEYLINHPYIKFAIACVVKARSKSLLRQNFKCIGELMYNWGPQSKDRTMLLHLLQIQETQLPPNRNHAAVLSM